MYSCLHVRKGEITALETGNDSPGGLGRTSDLWSTPIGIADKMFAKQGTEDLKQQEEDWLVRDSFFSELVGQGQNQHFLFPISISQKGLRKRTYSPRGKFMLLGPRYSLAMLGQFAEFTVNKEMRGEKALFFQQQSYQVVITC